MESAPKDKKPARVWPVLRAYGKATFVYPWALTATVVGIIIAQVAGIFAPLYLRQFVNLLSTGTPSATVVTAIFVALILFGVMNLVSWIGDRVGTLASQQVESKVMTDLYKNAYDKLLGHAHEFFISNFTGTLTRRATRYSTSFEQVFDIATYNFLPTLLFVVGVVWILSLRSVWLGAGLFIWAVVFIYIQFRMMRSFQVLRAARTAEDSALTGHISDSISNHTTITAFASAQYESSQFGKLINQWYVATRRAWNASMRITSIQGLMAIFIELALLGGAVVLWGKGVVTVGDIVLIQVYILGIIDRVWGIGRSMNQLYSAFADATEMFDIMELPHGIQDVPNAPPLQVTEGAISFSEVNFHYDEKNREVLEHFSLDIAPREKVAIVGSSGAGKSTLVKLLLRLYNINSGAIEIDSQDISKVTQESLRTSIAFVSQEPILFHRSLMENIRYGRQSATDEEVIEAAKEAHCYEFIDRYPEKFNTMVGERGVKLSGGERQRVAIARAILKDAPILVLDEATSSLDSESEKFIQDSLKVLMEGKTVIVIAHRLSTVMHMDRLIIMEEGKVAVSGTHSELLAKESNLYKKLWEIQAGGFISND